MSQTQLGGVVWDRNQDGTLSPKRVVYTDAVLPDAVTPNNGIMPAVATQAIAQANAAGDNDGVVFAPWEDRPHA